MTIIPALTTDAEIPVRTRARAGSLSLNHDEIAVVSGPFVLAASCD